MSSGLQILLGKTILALFILSTAPVPLHPYAHAQVETSMDPEENKISSDPSVSQEVLIEELQKIFKAYQKKEEKAFLDKWPVRVAGAAVRGLLPTAGVSLFKPYDPLMKPTLGATFVAQD